ERADLILAHERAVADHVGSKDRGKPSLHTCLRPPWSIKRLRAAYSTPASDASVCVRYDARVLLLNNRKVKHLA
ncbi:hypothetical protein NKH34_31455, partial [Mesorhizobium sp. M1148]|uniref:hypothetical protein n=1 Tax=unclassified Mesorhizobium TaxID=325217 RepID=UPI0033358721